MGIILNLTLEISIFFFFFYFNKELFALLFYYYDFVGFVGDSRLKMSALTMDH
jgi:hypothetical protein